VEQVNLQVGATKASKASGNKQAAHVDSVDLLVVDVESSLGELLLPGIKALQVAFIVAHKPALQHSALIHSLTHLFTRSLIHSFVRSFVCSFVRSFVRSFVHSYIQYMSCPRIRYIL